MNIIRMKICRLNVSDVYFRRCFVISFYLVPSASPGSSPFISDLFFLLQTYQHLGINKTLDNRDRADKNVREFKKDLKRLEAERSSWQPGVSQFDKIIRAFD
jgi:hypothetical protein